MNRTIYFAGSIRGGRDDRAIYSQLIRHLGHYGTVLTEHIAEEGLTSSGEEGLSDEEIYCRDMAWLTESDTVVAEVTTPSLGVGYELARAAEMRKQVICLWRPQPGRRLSAMIAGCPGIAVREYLTVEEAIQIIDELLR
jgi:hypothetical protein